MVIDLTPEQEAHLQQIADLEGKTPQEFLINVALGAREEDTQFRRFVSERVRQADLGVFIEKDKMDARIDQMLGR